jgi:hypothetical protein
MIYGTFVFGYDADDAGELRPRRRVRARAGALHRQLQPLTPMPGTALYDRLRSGGTPVRDAWWLDAGYRYGDSIFVPRGP